MFRKNLDLYFRPNVELVVDDVDAHLQQEALNLVDNINKVTKHLKFIYPLIIAKFWRHRGFQ